VSGAAVEQPRPAGLPAAVRDGVGPLGQAAQAEVAGEVVRHAVLDEVVHGDRERGPDGRREVDRVVLRLDDEHPVPALPVRRPRCREVRRCDLVGLEALVVEQHDVAAAADDRDVVRVVARVLGCAGVVAEGRPVDRADGGAAGGEHGVEFPGRLGGAGGFHQPVRDAAALQGAGQERARVDTRDDRHRR
jgi:hypothetical protein